MAISLVIAAALAAAPPPPPPPNGSVCTAASGSEAISVEYLRGRYRVLGIRGHQPYTGHLLIGGAEGSGAVTLAGTVAGAKVQGTARKVRCGADRVPRLEVTLQRGGATDSLFCVPHTDYDNFNRASCSRQLSDPNGDIELWHEWYAP